MLSAIVGYWSVMTALTAAAGSAISFFVDRFLFGATVTCAHATSSAAFPPCDPVRRVAQGLPEMGNAQIGGALAQGYGTTL